MASNFPTAQPGAKTDYDNQDDVASIDQNSQGEDINALGAKLGHGDSNNAPATNKLLRGTAAGKSEWDTDFLDEDDFSSNSDTGVPTQQSTKAYISSIIEAEHNSDGTHTTDSIDAITEIASGIKTGSDAKLVTGTAGTTNYTSKWNEDGDLVDGYEVKDEDTMVSDSATALATQQSIKAYVDNETTGGTDWIDGTHLSTDFGASSTEMLNFVPNFSGDNVLNRNGGAAVTTFTDVDLSSVVPSTCKAVLLAGSIKQDCGDVRHLRVRPNGVTGTSYASIATASSGTASKGILITGVVGQTIEYSQDTAGGTNSDCDYTLDVLGWWEQAQQ